MANGDRRFLFVTANIGSLFEEYGTVLRTNWISAFGQLIAKQTPLFVALNLQEVGGKAWNPSREDIHSYFERISNSEPMTDYTCCNSYVDEETNDEVKYTALGCSFFVHKSLADIEQWNFNENCFSPLKRERRIDGITNEMDCIRKTKFPLSCYSKKTKQLHHRKGFTWTRWKIFNKEFDLLNVHLTHDACNVNCTLKSPTKYSKYRRRALEFLVDKTKEQNSDHRILFGDFNVRPDTKELVEHLMENIGSKQVENDDAGKPCSIVYKSLNESNTDLLQIKNKIFKMSSYDAFNVDKVPNLIRFDREFNWLKDGHPFKEMPIKFQPTYPHKEDPEDGGTTFGSVRCPSWCDRIVIDSDLYEGISQCSDFSYDSFGESLCLGDHKPVFLSFNYPGVLADQ